MTKRTMASRRRPRREGSPVIQFLASKVRGLAAIGWTRVRDGSVTLARAGGRRLAAADARLKLIGALSAVTVVAVSVGMLGGDGEPADSSAEASRSIAIAPIAEPVSVVEIGPDVDPSAMAGDAPGQSGEPALTELEEAGWHYVQVASGETLERIFRRLGLGPTTLHAVVSLNEDTRRLSRIRPGDEFAFALSDQGEFLALRAEIDDQNWLFVELTPDGLATRTESRALEHRVVRASGEIRSSLFNAGRDQGLSDNMTLRMANIFGWDIDFALDIRAGDRFAVVYEEIYRDGQFLRDGNILAARFINQGRSYEAIRFDNGGSSDFYAPDGRPMRKPFLRAPLNFTRVTSNFNPRRFHPITRQVRPHNGTDYGAATGTPVWAAGDGRVTRSAYNNRNGNYIFVQHGNHVETRYLHLSRRMANVGDRVRQGQTIGLVGATGMATGPHLHYEFLVHGAHRNPRTVDLPEAEPLPGELLPEFKQHASPLLAKLDELSPRVLLASAGGDCADDADSDC